MVLTPQLKGTDWPNGSNWQRQTQAEIERMENCYYKQMEPKLKQESLNSDFTKETVSQN
jgi:hypothetical protein